MIHGMGFRRHRREIRRLQDEGVPLPPSLWQATPARQIEFLAGRGCAMAALRTLGYNGSPMVASRADRSPIWPRGWTGSISHCSDHAVAVVARGDGIRRLGIDVEDWMNTDTAMALAGQLSSAAERALLGNHGFSQEQSMTFCFSAKEALYKSLYPFQPGHLDFRDAELTDVFPAKGMFEIRLYADIGDDGQLPRRFLGGYRCDPTRLVTLIWVPSCESGPSPHF